jgi:anaerobic magnesium-protoporphyrin IX monomethyl ester cyclase
MKPRVQFVEPPKDYWFLMGDYRPPPTVLLTLAAYVEAHVPDVEVDVVDSQGEGLDWDGVERRIAGFRPTVVGASGFTCNAYVCARIAETAKRVDPGIVTVAGGQHFTAVPEESLRDFPEIDYIVRGEGEETLAELVRTVTAAGDVGAVQGLTFRHDGGIVHTPDRPMIGNLDDLPFPAYHLVAEHVHRYHFALMAGKDRPYAILEGSRGCDHRCTFCSQWRHWDATWRTKSPGRIADEMEYIHNEFGGEFLWLTDDNFDYRRRGLALAEELQGRDLPDDLSWFCQARTDDIVRDPELVRTTREAGNSWILMGVESDSSETLRGYRKGARRDDAFESVRVLKDADIFAQAMFIIGARSETAETVERLRRFSLDMAPDLAIYACLTPMPGTEVHDEAERNGWIEDRNYAHYDMAHAIMPTETLSRRDVQEQLYRCYRAFYGSIPKGIAGVFARNEIKRRAYRHMATQRVLRNLRGLV